MGMNTWCEAPGKREEHLWRPSKTTLYNYHPHTGQGLSRALHLMSCDLHLIAMLPNVSYTFSLLCIRILNEFLSIKFLMLALNK
jgi:hypothetical protein